MASNTVLNAGTGGDTVVTKERTHDGDASKQQGVFLSGVSGTEGAYTFVDVDAGGGVEAAALRVTIASDSTGVLSVDDNGASLTVDNAGLTELAAAINASAQMDVNIAASGATVPVSNAGLTELAAAINVSSQVDVNVAAALPAGTNNIGDVDVLTVPADPFGANADAASATGSISAKLRFIAGTGIPITGTVTVGSHNVTNAGTFAVQNTAQASTNTQEIVGDVADDAAASGNPVLICGVAVETDGTDPTTVSAEGDAAQLRTDRARRLLVSEHHPRSFFTSADYATAQTNTSVQAAPGAGLSLYITDIVISNGATAGNVTLLDGSGGTVKFEIYPAINGGVSISLRQPIRLTANTALVITSTTVTTHSVNIGGYTAP